jgi:hypothetical protein
MKEKSRVIEHENQRRLERVLNTFNTQLHTLRSLKTASKKRRALKRAANDSTLAMSRPSMKGQRTQRNA